MHDEDVERLEAVLKDPRTDSSAFDEALRRVKLLRKLLK